MFFLFLRKHLAFQRNSLSINVLQFSTLLIKKLLKYTLFFIFHRKPLLLLCFHHKTKKKQLKPWKEGKPPEKLLVFFFSAKIGQRSTWFFFLSTKIKCDLNFKQNRNKKLVQFSRTSFKKHSNFLKQSTYQPAHKFSILPGQS